MKQIALYLVIRSDQSCRVAKRPRLASDEIAIPLYLKFPSTWGRVLTDQSITLEVPDFTPLVDYAPAGGTDE